MAIVADLCTGGFDGVLFAGSRTPVVVEKVVDFSVVENNLESGEWLAAIRVPKGVLVDNVCYEILKVEGASATVDIGLYADSGDSVTDVDGFYAAADLTAAVGTMGYYQPGAISQLESGYYTVSASPAYSRGVITTADSYIGITYKAGTLISQAKIKLCARLTTLIDLEPTPVTSWSQAT